MKADAKQLGFTILRLAAIYHFISGFIFFYHAITSWMSFKNISSKKVSAHEESWQALVRDMDATVIIQVITFVICFAAASYLWFRAGRIIEPDRKIQYLPGEILTAAAIKITAVCLLIVFAWEGCQVIKEILQPMRDYFLPWKNDQPDPRIWISRITALFYLAAGLVLFFKNWSFARFVSAKRPQDSALHRWLSRFSIKNFTYSK